MSLGVVVKGTEGMVLAADSRVTLFAAKPGVTSQIPVNFDNASKLLTFEQPNNFIGAVTWGQAIIGTAPKDVRTAYSFVPEFEAGLPRTRSSVCDFAKKFSDFFLTQWKRKMPKDYKGSDMIFVIGGFNEKSPYGSVYLVNIPTQPIPQEQSPNDFGVTWGGQAELASRLLLGYGPDLLKIVKAKLNLSDKQVEELKQHMRPLALGVPYAALPLQDCIDLAVFLIKATIEAQKLSIQIRGVGGAIDVAVITRRAGLRIIQQKQLIGEKSTQIERR